MTEAAIASPTKTSAPVRVDPLIWGSPVEPAEATTAADPLEALGGFGAAKVPPRILFGGALAGVGALALLAAAFGLGADRAQSEPTPSAETATLAPVDPLLWESPAKAADETSGASPAAVSLDAVREACAANDSPWMRFWEGLWRVSAIGVLAAAAEAIRRHRRRRKLRLQALFEVNETPDEWAAAPAPPALRQAPRFLPSNPYLNSARPHRLVRQIENAAEASLEFGRVLGVVFFDLGDPPLGADGGAAVEWTEAAAELVFNLQGASRPTDHVALLDDRYLVVCIALLPGRTELIGIGERVRGIGQASPTFAAAFARQAGLSIFPLCGYRGEELIDYARTDFQIRNAMPAASPPRLEDKLERASEGNA